MNNQIESIGSVLLEEYMKGYNVGFSDGTKEGREDTITELLYKMAEKFIEWDSKVKGIREDKVCFFTIENILKGIEELKAEVSKNANES